MPNRLRRILFSVPVITLAGLLTLYAVAGFLALPAIVKWQVEKQVNEKFGHRISVAKVRFNPFSFRFEIEGVALSDPEGRPMLGFRRALVDFELRSVIDRAWTFADAVLEAPTLSFGIEKNGRHNFSALLERLGDTAEPDKEAGALPRIVVRRMMLSEGRAELSDALLDPLRVTRFEPLVIEIGGLSTVPGQTARFRIAAWTAAGETFETQGEFGLNPVASKGQLKLGAAQVSTLVRGLSRVLALESGSGTVDFSASFDVALDSAGKVSGGAHDVGLDVANLSVVAAGADQPLIAIETLSLNQGRIDLDTRDVTFAGFRIAKGSVAASADAKGTIDWAKIVRVSAARSGQATASQPANPPSSANAAPTANEPSLANAQSSVNAQPWKLSVASTQVSEIALSYSDAAQGRHAKVAALGIDVATSAQIGSEGMRIEIDKPRVSIAGVRVENGSDFLGLPGALVQAGRISISSAGRRFDLAFDSPSVALAEGLSARQGDASLELRAVSVQGGRVELGGADASMSGAIEVPKITASGVAVDQSGQKAALADASFEASRISLQAGESRFDVAIDKLRTTLAALKAERGAEGLDLRNASIVGEKLSVGQADGTLRVLAASPVVELSGVAARRGAERAKLETFSFASGSVSLASGGGASGGGSGAKLDLGFEKIRGAASALAMNSGADGIDLRNAAVGGESVTVSQRDGGFSVAGRGARASVAGVAARQGADRIVLQDAEFEAAALSASSGGAVSDSAMRSAAGAGTVGASTAGVATAGGTALDARIDGAALRLASLDVTALGASSELARVGQANIAAKSLAMRIAEGPMDLTGEGLSAALSKVLVRSPADATDLVRVGSAKLNGGALRLRDRVFSAEQLELADGQAKTWIDAQGRFNLLTAFEAPSAPGATGAAAATPRSATTAKTSQQAGAAPTEAPWRVAMKSIALDGFAVGFEDRSQSPALALGVDAIRARVAGLDTAGQAPMKIEFDANLASGGQLQARGEVRADTGQSDLAVKVAGLALAPVQPYLSQFAELRLASGTVSTEGRLRYGDAARANAKLAYEGRIAIERLLLEENEPKRPFVSWDTVVSDDVVFTLEPNRVDIGELRIDGPSGRLIIAEDQSVNLMDVLKKPKEGEEEKADGAGKEPKPAAESEKASDEDPFPVTIARLRVSGGVLEFADLSLRPQFGTRMHELEGVITGLGTDVNRSAKVQLDARVDKYGSAKIRGQLSVMRPEKLTDIELSFRNLEMSALSPYVAKFAGYRIASGRLALDLQYKVDDGKLLGQNKVVLNQVELGEKVDSPDALDLPLELAIAILKDSKGVIDIGLPVSGDLGDPKFDYGAVIGKAIGNLLGNIVTAPFRMLGALFASGDDGKIGTIDFEPGSAAIAPPERQKLEAVARALKERPALSLVVPPTYASAEDTPALKSRAVRSDIVRRMGVELKPGEDPGPIDTANPRAQRAVETTFSERYAPEVLAALKRRAAEDASPTTGTPVKESAAPTASATAAQSAASAAMASAASPAPSSAETPAKAAGTGAQRPARPARGPSPEFYQSLVDRLIAEQPLTEPMLAQLATRRGEAIVRELTTVGGVPEARVALGEPRKATESGDKAVTLRLELEVAK